MDEKIKIKTTAGERGERGHEEGTSGTPRGGVRVRVHGSRL